MKIKIEITKGIAREDVVLESIRAIAEKEELIESDENEDNESYSCTFAEPDDSLKIKVRERNKLNREISTLKKARPEEEYAKTFNQDEA